MRARCSICQETLDDALAPLTTACGHLYCADCATRHFARGVDPCAICRAGPYDLDDLVRLYPDYVRTPPRTPPRTPSPQPSPSSSHARARARGKRPAARMAGMSAIDACYDVLEDRDVLGSPALGTALDRCAHLLAIAPRSATRLRCRTDELVVALEEMGAPDIRVCLMSLDRMTSETLRRLYCRTSPLFSETYAKYVTSYSYGGSDSIRTLVH